MGEGSGYLSMGHFSFCEPVVLIPNDHQLECILTTFQTLAHYNLLVFSCVRLTVLGTDGST